MQHGKLGLENAHTKKYCLHSYFQKQGFISVISHIFSKVNLWQPPMFSTLKQVVVRSGFYGQQY